jgi:hypothetical protein
MQRGGLLSRPPGRVAPCAVAARPTAGAAAMHHHPCSRGVCCAAAASRGKSGAADAPSTSDRPDEDDGEQEYVAVESGGRATDGTPTMRLMGREDVDMPLPYVPIAEEGELVRDVHLIERSRPAEVASVAPEVPGMRMTIDPAEVDLIGEGLPILRGVRSRG